LYSVKEVISPELLSLSNGLIVRLIGVTQEPVHHKEAIHFLDSKTKGQRIFLKFDKDKHDENGNLLSYVYLKNKTVINAHLIKSGLVSVDVRRDYKYRNKFENLFNHANA
jgi:site-specific DNA-methyltransferase (adenine-specific)